jgi:hypothetical protein
VQRETPNNQSGARVVPRPESWKPARRKPWRGSEDANNATPKRQQAEAPRPWWVDRD